MKHKIITVILTAMLLCLCLSVSVFAAAGETSGSCGQNAEWSYDEGTKTLTISGTGEMTDFSFMFDAPNQIPWKEFREEAVKVVIEKGITYIGDESFDGFTALTSVSIPSTVTAIGEEAFAECKSLPSVEIPVGVTTIGYHAFDSCKSLSSVTIPNTVATIGQYAFSFCEALPAVTIPNSVTSIGASAFYGCTALKSVVVPDSVTELGDSCFNFCTALTSAKLPANLKEVPTEVFAYCTALKEVQLPKQPEVLGGWAFIDCTSLTKINLPESLLEIGDGAFEGCTALESAPLPSNLKILGSLAFCQCTALKEVRLPEGLEAIGSGALRGCSGITELTIPESVTELGENLVYDASALHTIYYNAVHVTGTSRSFYQGGDAETGVTLIIGDKVEVIPWNLCMGFESLKTVRFGKSVREIGSYAFSECKGLTSVELPKSLERIGDYSFNACNSGPTLVIPDSVTTIGEAAFANWYMLETVTFGKSLTSVGDDAFLCCNRLQSPKFPASLRHIGDMAFSQCQAFERVELPEGLESIGNLAFSNCSALTEGNIPTTVTKVGRAPYENCPLNNTTEEGGVTILDRWVLSIDETATASTIPEGVVGIAAGVGGGHDTLTSVTLPNSLKYIGDYAFRYASELTTVSGGQELTTVGTEALFYTPWFSDSDLVILGNTLLSCNADADSITIPDTIVHIGDEAFYNGDVKEIVVPETVETIGSRAFASNTLTSLRFAGAPDKTVLNLMTETDKDIIYKSELLSSVLDSWYIGGESGRDISFTTDGTATSSLVARLLVRQIMEEEGIDDILSAYDWVCANMGYGGQGINANYAFSGMFIGGGLCQGYAMTMKAFLDELNVPNFVQQGTIRDQYGRYVAHAWNVVKLGTWYNLDATETRPGDYSTYMRDDEYISSGYNNMEYSWNQESRAASEEATLAAFEERKTVAQPLSFTLQEDGTYLVSDCAIGAVDVTVPAVYEGKPVTAIGADAFRDCAWLERVVIPEGVVRIGSNAFRNCLALRTVELPASLETLEYGCFISCIYLNEIDFSHTHISQLPNFTFEGCLNLVRIKLPMTIAAVTSRCVSSSAINAVSGQFYMEIHGYEGSVAESLAKDMSWGFVSLGTVTHTEVTDPAVEATCTEDGLTEGEHCSDCGAILVPQEPVPALGHEEVVTPGEEATCTEEGLTEGKYCSRCDEVLTAQEPVPALGHKEITDPAKEATCTEEGLTEGKHCKRCAAVLTEQKSIPVKGHTSKTIPAEAPKCGEEGLTEGEKCSVCGTILKQQETVPALEHDYGPWVEDPPATCTTGGMSTKTCKLCGDVQKRLEGKKLHTKGEPVRENEIPPTCTEDGSYEQVFYCIYCGTYEISRDKNMIPKTGHDFGDWTVVTEPTYEAVGEERRSCANCDRSESKELPKLKPTATPEPTPTATVKPTPTATVKPTPTATVKPTPTATVKPTPTATVKPTPTATVKPTPTPVVTPTPTPTVSPEPILNPFTDVSASDYFYAPVLWAVQQSITSGTSATTFSPEAPCTRAQVVTFLWKAAGSPTPDGTDNRFQDVTPADYYYTAVLWAVNEGITSGVSNTSFGPNAVCTRAQVATFLWRAQGSPMISDGGQLFYDVPLNAYYFEAVKWAVQKGVTSGVGPGSFGPDQTCTRAQIATFLYHAMQ